MSNLAYSAKYNIAYNNIFRGEGDGDNCKKKRKSPDDGTLRWVVKKGLRKFTVKMILTYFDLDHAKILGLVLLRRHDELMPQFNSDQQSDYREMIHEIETYVTF